MEETKTTDEKWGYPQDGDKLEDYHPRLEFRMESGEWVPSGLVFGLMQSRFDGRYRYPL